MKKLYLDFNVVSYLRSGKRPDLEAAHKATSADHVTYFSPAHLEDIAASAIRAKTPQEIISAEIEFLATITQNNALRPTTRTHLETVKEHPQECYARVISQYEGNDLAEAIDAAVLADANQNPAGDPKEMNNVAPEAVLQHIRYREAIARALLLNGLISADEAAESFSWTFAENLRDRFYLFEAYVSLAANLLEKIGYYREKESQARARLHDVSHIIYGAYCDSFVSGDVRLIKKAQAIYSLLGIETKVLTDKEFAAKH